MGSKSSRPCLTVREGDKSIGKLRAQGLEEQNYLLSLLTLTGTSAISVSRLSLNDQSVQLQAGLRRMNFLVSPLTNIESNFSMSSSALNYFRENCELYETINKLACAQYRSLESPTIHQKLEISDPGNLVKI